ncbi:hypothetical protein ACFX15_003571 [Malus domestica]
MASSSMSASGVLTSRSSMLPNSKQNHNIGRFSFNDSHLSRTKISAPSTCLRRSPTNRVPPLVMSPKAVSDSKNSQTCGGGSSSDPIAPMVDPDQPPAPTAPLLFKFPVPSGHCPVRRRLGSPPRRLIFKRQATRHPVGWIKVGKSHTTTCFKRFFK